MKTTTKILVSAAVASVSACATLRGHTPGDDPSNPMGRCYGVVGKEQGDCGGKDPSTGKTWSCSGENPTADLGWKKMSRDQCERTEKHPTATTKRFEPFPA